ncbi:MAG: DUF4383 domain-containing protein [Ktedonobacterales bacterium]
MSLPQEGGGPSRQEALAGDSTTEVVQASSTIGAPPEEAVVTAPVARYFALLTGAGLTLLGVLGWIPPLTRGGALLDILRVTPTANVLHLITGLAGLAVWRLNKRGYATFYAVAIGFVYLIYFSLGNIVFGNLDGTVVLDTFARRVQWILYNAMHAGLMLSGFVVAALAAMQRGDRATRRYRRQRRWFWQTRTRIPTE